MASMRIAMVVVAATASVAHADPKSYDDLMRPADMVQPLDMRPKSDHRIDMLGAAVERGHDRLWQVVDVTALVASTAALACDWGQTRGVSQGGWMSGGTFTGNTKEYNPLLGASPSPRTLDLYFATTVVINAALWVALPKRWRSIVPAAVVGAEARTIYRNIPYTGMCKL